MLMRWAYWMCAVQSMIFGSVEILVSVAVGWACRLFLISCIDHLSTYVFSSKFRTDSRTLLFFLLRRLFAVSFTRALKHKLNWMYSFTFEQLLQCCSTVANNCPLHFKRPIDDGLPIQFTARGIMVGINIIPFNDWNVWDNLRWQLCGMCSASSVS